MQKDENNLIKMIHKDDALAFDALFELYGQRLFGFAMNYLKTESEAEELVQDVFVRVWENRKSIQSGDTFKAYLFKIALNQIRKHFRQKAVVLRYLAHLDQPEFEKDTNTEDSIEYGSVLQRVEEIIKNLPKRKREIFTLSKIDGMSSKEIAQKLNITPGAVDNQVSDALKAIRKALCAENLTVLLYFALFLS